MRRQQPSSTLLPFKLLKRSEQSVCQIARCTKSMTCTRPRCNERQNVRTSPDKMSERFESVGFRKPDAERAPTTDFAFCGDLATLPLDQCLTYRKTETGSALAFSRKEGIEDLFHHVRVHANSGVGHFDDDAGIAVP